MSRGLRSPLADAVMLAAYVALERRSVPALWAMFGYGSDGELTVAEIEAALARLAKVGGLWGAWGLTAQMTDELEEVIKSVHTEASAIPVESARGAWGERAMRQDLRRVKLTPLTGLTFSCRLRFCLKRSRGRRGRSSAPGLSMRRTTRCTRSASRANSIWSARNTRARMVGLVAERVERDVWVLMASRGARSFAYSCLNVIFAIYLSQLGYSTVTIGLVISTAYVSSAILTLLWGYLSDRYGRRKILMLLAALTVVSNLIYVFFSQLVFIFIAVIVTNIGAGGTGGGGQGGGPFNPVEQALLAEKCTPESRNRIFSLNAFVGSILGSLGALFSGLPEYLQEHFGWDPILSYKPLFVVTIVLSIA
jgi:hypothetical protein